MSAQVLIFRFSAQRHNMKKAVKKKPSAAPSACRIRAERSRGKQKEKEALQKERRQRYNERAKQKLLEDTTETANAAFQIGLQNHFRADGLEKRLQKCEEKLEKKQAAGMATGMDPRGQPPDSERSEQDHSPTEAAKSEQESPRATITDITMSPVMEKAMALDQQAKQEVDQIVPRSDRKLVKHRAK